ncbi:methyl-accepting chemotaxis protein [Paenibacillus nasutitermitis]|uniref:Methyl-accepting chemotaxis protein n=1 Tax=Paenibacillus nasutitermitis TaxID=1652958 RepID=A0A917DPT1_9BACL|nr:methyl-accepting chemotaxis protein [Paenibacillus nasutitermitis]GGD55106.1 methyl-accepting chemotaxis protein [Paenibacillus nasutitermitis]
MKWTNKEKKKELDGSEAKKKDATKESYSSSLSNLKKIRLGSPLKSVGIKLFLIIFSAILVCVLFVGLFSYSTSKSIIKKKVSESSSVAIAQSKGKLDLMFRNYEDLTMQLMLDKNVQENLQVLNSSKEEYAKFEAMKKLTDTVQTYVIGNSTIVGVSIVPINAGAISSITVGGSSVNAGEAQQSEWMKQVVEGDGRLVWLPTKVQGYSGNLSEPSFALSRVLKNTISNEGKYIIVVEVFLKELGTQLEDLKLGDNSEITIVTKDNKIVYSADEAELEKDSLVVLPDDSKSAATGSLQVNDKNGEEVLAMYHQFATLNWKILGTVPVKELVKDAAKIRDWTWIIAAIAAVLAAGIGLLVIRMVAMPLGRLRNLMNEGESGNLYVRSNVKTRDEIGQLSQSFNQMMAQITALVNQTTQSAHDVLSTAGELTDASKKTAISAKEIAVATEEIANGATSLAMEAEKGSDLTSEISIQMKEVMDANQQMGVSASEVENASRQGTVYMNSLIEKTGLTEEMTRSMVEKVDRLKDSTSSIRKILDVLNNISKQTNILSLNATIEAARAGTAGKGFMVVADEIRKLADQSRQSIDVVGQFTDTIQKEIDETVNVLSDAYPIFQEQIGSVKEANQIFLTVQSQMGQFVDRLSSVTESISVLERSQLVLSDAMGNVSAVAEESSATSEEVASLSNEQTNISEGLVGLSDKLQTVSTGLKETLSRFRTEKQ